MLLFFLLSYSYWLLQGSLGLRITGISVPTEVQLGADVLLECSFDLEGSNLYALKWYKGQHEFYRFILKEVPPVQVFPWANVNIIHNEESTSFSHYWRTTMSAAAVNAGRVLLQNVTLAAEGVYKCEVSTEAPNFNTDYKESNLSIIEVKSERPTISWLQGRPDWNYGDIFHFKCFMNGTRPSASRLSWLLNGQPAPSGLVEPSDPVLINGYYNAQLGLRLLLQPQLFTSAGSGENAQQQLELTCLSRIGGTGQQKEEGHVPARGIILSRSKWLITPPPVAMNPAGQSSNNTTEAVQSSEADSEESPSVRRTQPVVGSYPGRAGKNNGPDSNRAASHWRSRLHCPTLWSTFFLIATTMMYT